MLHRFDILQQVGAFRLMVEGSLQEEDEEIQEVDEEIQEVGEEIHEASAEEHQEVDSERASKQIPEVTLGPGPIKRSHLMNKNLKMLYYIIWFSNVGKLSTYTECIVIIMLNICYMYQV